MSSVTVLTPNARRQTIKVTPNTTLLKVLEEVCMKHGLNPEEYDIRHHRKVMDLTVPIRFSGLPNNALLEMIPVQKRRQDAHVTVALQLEETLHRFTEDFMPSDSLWTVIERACPEETRNTPKVPVVVYMHRKIVGIACLSKTLLKDLGLTSGRAVLRLSFHDSEATPEMKAVGSGLYIHPQLPATVPAPVQTGKEENLEHLEQQQQVQESNRTVTTVLADRETDKTAVNIDRIATSHGISTKHSSKEDVLQTVQRLGDSEQQSKSTAVDKQVSYQNVNDKISYQPQQQSTVIVDSDQHVKTVTDASDETELDRCSSEHVDVENIEYVGERNALIFNPASEGPAMEVSLPDDFFNITVEDVRYLMRDLRRLREDLEHQPLTTNATKELNTSTQTLSLLHNYKHTVIRVQFPDRLVLQAIFSPLDTIETVMEFVKQFLEQPDLPFYLYSTPPKQILEREQRLVEANCVPRALLYFGVTQSSEESSQQQQQQQKYLKSSLLSSVTTQKQASTAALQVRRLDRSESRDKTDNDMLCSTVNVNYEMPKQDQNQQNPHESLHSEPGPSGTPQNTSGPSVNKMPKWFKPV